LSRPIALGAGGARRAELFVDVLNVLNDTAEESLGNDNLFSPTFGQPSAFVDPRRAMVGRAPGPRHAPCARHGREVSRRTRVAVIEAQLGGKTLQDHFREQAELIDRLFPPEDLCQLGRTECSYLAKDGKLKVEGGKVS
jgi:hypothetical protein